MEKALTSNLTVKREIPAGNRGAAAVTGAVPRELFLLVLALPELQGAEVCERIRHDPSLSGLAIAALELVGEESVLVSEGGDATHGQPKPPNAATAVAGIKKLLGCKPLLVSLDRVIEAGDLLIDPRCYRVTRAGTPTTLTMLEFQLLYYLASRPNRLFTRNQLFAALWRGSRALNPRVVDAYIHRVRLKIENDPGNPVHLTTLKGMGYQFVRLKEGKHDALTGRWPSSRQVSSRGFDS